jgi:lysophospholipase L1-like esterase
MLWVAAGLISFGMGCGESTAPPVPVATVTLSPSPSLDLVPSGTDVIQAIPKDAEGNPLTNRITTWSSSDPSKVTVAAGVVSGIALGSATITATIEGQSASETVTVKDGAVVSTSGLTFSAQSGAVTVAIPAGALTASKNVTVAPAQSPPTTNRLMPGTAFEFGPNGITFAQPVTLTIKYNPSNLAAGSPEAALKLYEAVGTDWQLVTGSTADVTAHTVSGNVSHFTVYGVLMATGLAVAAGDGESAAAGSPVATPPAVKVSDPLGNGVPGVAITFAVASGGGTITGATATTNASGIATVGSWTLGTTAGPNTLTASGTDLTPASVTFSASGVAGAPTTVAAVAGDNQTATAGGPVATLPAVKVTDANGNAVAGFAVVFAPTSGSGSVTGGSVVTNASGIATVGSWILGTVPGPQTLTATAGSLTGSPITFSATAVAPVPTRVVLVSGDAQTALINTAVATAPAVKVVDTAGIGVPNFTVVFAVASGGGSVSGGQAVTNVNGFASVGAWILGPNPGANTLTAAAGSLQGSPITFSATGITNPPAAMAIAAGNQQSVNAGTAVPIKPAVLVTDANGAPVPGVTVGFSIRSGSGAITGANAVSNVSGVATLGSWTLGVGGNSLFAAIDGVAGSPLIFVGIGTVAVQVVTFGDSNTDFGFSGTDPNAVYSSYISNAQSTSIRTRLGPNDPITNTLQLAGKIQAVWRATRTPTIRVVNHGIAGTGTGTGRDLIFTSPNAREAVAGVTRFQGEVLGAAYPWNGGESTNSSFPDGPVARVQSFTPRQSDFAYVSMGTNDIAISTPTSTILTNLEWMIDQWTSLGLPVSHFMITTIPPRTTSAADEAAVTALNTGIRSLAQRKGAKLIDLVTFCSNDNGATWADPTDHVNGDLIHYSEKIRDAITSAVVSYISSLTP